MSEQPARRAEAAGGVVYRSCEGLVEVVLVGRPRSNFWALPKGRPEPGETMEQTACREVSEETGLAVEIVADVGSDRYSFSDPRDRVRIDKVVHHYLMVPRGGDLGQHDGEYDVASWFDIHEAGRRLTFPSQRAILERAGELIGERSLR